MSEYHKIQSVFKRDMDSQGKTLIEGVWTLPEFEYLADNVWVFTEKVDGTNIRITLPPYQEEGMQYGIAFGGRTDSAQIPAPLLQRLRDRFLNSAMRVKLASQFPAGAVLHGEGYGAKIQKGGSNYRLDQDFVLFDVRVGSWWLQRADVEDVARKLGIDVVPVIGRGTLHDAVDWAKLGIRSTWGDFKAEGIVARPEIELSTRGGDRLITKVKCRDFVS